MNIKNIKIGLVSMLFLLTVNLTAQETVTVPLTNPSKAGTLKMGIINGSITVTGYNGKEVIVKGIKNESKGRKDKRKGKTKNGMKRISNSSLEFGVEEFDNVVRVSSTVHSTTDFEIKVPKNFSLKISTVNRGNIYVENVNKDIIVSFIKVTPNVAMAFSSLNGDIDVTFPKTIKADVKVKSDRGEIYTDFDLKAKPSKAKVTKGTSKKGNAYRVKVEKWITGAINGGGPEILFKTFNGDVIIRSK